VAANEMPGSGTYWMATLNGQLIAGLSAQQPQMAAMGVPSTFHRQTARWARSPSSATRSARHSR
jgi:hypothetical protein